MTIAKRFLYILFLILVCSCTSIYADETKTLVSFDFDKLMAHGFPENQPKLVGPRVALVLSGGGARGLASIGALKVLERDSIGIDLVAGTSMGGIIGGLWAVGLSADSLKKLVKAVEWSSFFSDRPKRSSLFLTQREEGEKHLLALRFDGFRPTIPTAFTAGQKLTALLNKLSIEANYRCRHDFDNLKVPLRICAVDILTATPVTIRNGNLSDALRATMAVPIAFTPLEIDSMMLMDGGLVWPIPIEVAKNEGVDFIVVINTTSGLLKKEQILGPIDIANQTTTIMQLAAREKELSQADVVVSPDLQGHFATEFDHIDKLIAAGETAMMKAMPTIKKKLHDFTSSNSDTTAICVDSIVVPDFLVSLDAISELKQRLKSDNSIHLTSLKQTALEIANSGLVSHLELKLAETSNMNLLLFEASPLTITTDFGWIGNETLPDEMIDDALCHIAASEESGSVAMLQDVYNCITNVYKKHGYDLMQIDSIRYDNGKRMTMFYISEGLISRIMIVGNDHTKGWVIKRNFSLKPSEPFNLETAEKGMSNIFSTGLFEKVSCDVEHRNGKARVWIEVKEKKYKLIRFGAHYHEHYHAEMFADFADANVFGFSHEAFLRIIYGEMRKFYSFHLKADRIFETYFTYHFQLYHNRLKRDRYRDNKSIGFNRERYTGVSMAFGQQLSKLGTVIVEAHAEEIRIDLPVYSGLVHGSLRSLTFRSKVDNLDRYPFPEKGVAAHFYLEVASDILGGDHRYKKAYFDWRSQIPITNLIGLQPAFAIGLSDIELPMFSKFFLGGNRNFYGYHYNALDGDKLIRGNLGIRFRLPYRFYVTGRYDLGNVWTTFEDIRIKNLRHAFGMDLSYSSPLGSISVSYGIAENKYHRLYIDVGYEF